MVTASDLRTAASEAPWEATSVWHAGERAIQRRAGVLEKMEAVGRRNVRDAMPEQHRSFFAQLPFLVAGSVDDGGAPWATILTGEPGFVASPTPTSLDIAARPGSDDPAAEGLRAGGAVGLLGIELGTRRRNRANGTIRAVTTRGLEVEVEQSFGNCPQYIQLRDPLPSGAARPPAPAAEVMEQLDEAARATIAVADTFFVASYADSDGRRHVDVSHRGGKPGFVRIATDGTLTIPDFAGNLFFMTLGNVLLSGKAGLVFPDWETGDLLQVTGDAALVEDHLGRASFDGAERLWTVRPRRVVRRRRTLPQRWAMRQDGWSPTTLATGAWRETAAPGARWRPLKVTRIVDESRSVRSFHLAPADGNEAVAALAGQHLPIRLPACGTDGPMVRTYTLSSAPGAAYRISVKRDGAVSRHLHDHVAVGDVVEAKAPAGGFTIDADTARPAALLGGGIGITPLVAMLHHLVDEGLRHRAIRPTTLFHAAHDVADRAFDEEIARLVERADGALHVVRVLGQPDNARKGEDYDEAGRIDMPLLARHSVALDDTDFYVCGPPAFAQGLYDGLRGSGVADGRIHAEAFGPSALKRDSDAPAGQTTVLPPAATGPVRVVFEESGKEADWTPASGSLLELAERQGLEPAFGCRSGSCGSCRTRLLGGGLTYHALPSAERADDEALICCAVPAEGAGEIRLAL